MGVRREVLYVNKSSNTKPHERIVNIGGVSAIGSVWKLSQQQAIIGLESETWEYFMKKEDKILNIIVAKGEGGSKYLKTEEDGEQPENLLKLPEFPEN